MNSDISYNQALRALILEDMASVRMLLRAVLSDLQLEIVAEAKVISRGLELFREIEPDIVFLDLGLPDGNGLSIIQQLKRERPHVCIAILSADAGQQNVQSASELGADHFIAKPFTAKRIGQIVDQVVRLRHFNVNTPSD